MNSNVISTLQRNINIEWGEGGSLLILHKKSLIVPRFLAKIVDVVHVESCTEIMDAYLTHCFAFTGLKTSR